MLKCSDQNPMKKRISVSYLEIKLYAIMTRPFNLCPVYLSLSVRSSFPEQIGFIAKTQNVISTETAFILIILQWLDYCKS